MSRVDEAGRFNLLAESGGMRRVNALRIPAADIAAVAETSWVVEELALFIDVAEVGMYTLMWTRTDAPAAAGFVAADGVIGEQIEPDALALSAGFLFTEGIIDGMADIAEMAICPDSPDVVRVRLVAPPQGRATRRGGFIASSCGVCGGVDGIGDLRSGLPVVPQTLHVAPPDFQQIMVAMESRQLVFNTTGGTHAAALFAADRSILAAAEDLGRHNALDKVIGRCLLRGTATAGSGAVLSGRVSLELVVKAARAGVEIVAAVSAPSSLAIDAAQQFGITLCGFVRNGRLTAYTHPQRLV
ncbi:MAG: formate dehydrogenase accessory sulfurtransferase FdhD [Sterolibacterium sp.]|jgi:FdhD protein